MIWLKSAAMAYLYASGRKLGNGYDREGFLVTKRDIQPGEELLWFYNTSQPYRELNELAPTSPRKEVQALMRDAALFQQTLQHQDKREQQLLKRSHPHCTNIGNRIGRHILGQGVVGGCLTCIKYQNASFCPIRPHDPIA